MYKSIKLYFLTFVLSITLAGISSLFALEPSTWKIGALLCMSGACAETGTNSVQGLRLAVDEINTSGGVLGKNIEIVLEDTAEGQSSGAGAVTAFQKLLLDPEIKYFVGPSWTPGGLSVAPLAAKRKDIIMTSPTLGVADFNEAGDNLFNVWPHDADASKFLAKYAFDRKWKRVAVFSSQQPWEFLQGNSFDAAFRQLGGEVVAKLEPLPTISDLRTECLKVRQAEPDAVFLSNFTQMGPASKQLRTIGYKGPLLAILMDDTRIKTSEGALEGTLVAGYAEPDSLFKDQFMARYKQKPTMGADTAYDVVKLYAWAVAQAKSFDAAKVQPILLAAKFQGASGLIAFDKHGGVVKTPVLYQVKGSELLRYVNEGKKADDSTQAARLE